jgi:acetyl-CoA carboxylase beta subunit
MNNQPPFILYTRNKREFLDKKCAICISTLYYPEINDKFVCCSQLNCGHIYHSHCIEESINYLQHNNNNNNKCPECRAIITNKKDISKSIEVAIRNDAFTHNNVDENLMQQFSNNPLQLLDYSYHKIVFERWRNEKNLNV